MIKIYESSNKFIIGFDTSDGDIVKIAIIPKNDDRAKARNITYKIFNILKEGVL